MINWNLLIILGTLSQSNTVKVNMQGSLSLGKDVIDTLTHYLRTNFINGRRSMSLTGDSEVISLKVKSAFLCRDLNFCDRNFAKFIDEYVIAQSKAVENIFKGLVLNRGVDKLNEEFPIKINFQEQLKHCLREIRKILENVDDKITEENEVILWTDIIKKISAKFQEGAKSFLYNRLDGKPQEINELKKRLEKEFVIATIIVEDKYHSKLCNEYKLCIKSFECTKALNILLDSFKTMRDKYVKSFIKDFYESLLDTGFYSKLDEVTANEFQIILNDMSYADDVPTKDVLLTVQENVANRLKSIETKTHEVNGYDVELLNMILSDMDHIYSKQRREPFHKFLSAFFEWTKTGGRLTTPFRKVFKDISSHLSFQSRLLVAKLINEVRVFLEITVDPEK